MATDTENRLSTGVSGLDDILHGGLIRKQAYLVRGAPGTGKSTLGLHFLSAGSSIGEPGMFISLTHPEKKLRGQAKSLGLSLAGVTFLGLSPQAKTLSDEGAYDMFASADVVREPTTKEIVEAVRQTSPKRIFVDPVTLLRFLSTDSLKLRKQFVAFIRFLEERDATIVWSSEIGRSYPDDDLQFASDGVIHLEFGQGGWTASVLKYFGSGYELGAHSMQLTGTGMKVFPKIAPDACTREFVPEQLPTGISGLDEMLHGGLERGTVTMISGPAGIGKTTIGLSFLSELAKRGERAMAYLFEEEPSFALMRSEGMGLRLEPLTGSGTLVISRTEPLLLSADEFAQAVRRETEENGARAVMIDNITAYSMCMRGEDLMSHLHRLCTYLQNMGVAVVLVQEVENITGDFRVTDIGINYMADNIIFARYFESRGTVRRAIGVLKKRLSDCDRTLRELTLSDSGPAIGPELRGLRGILRGMPEVYAADANSREGI
jgi:circadian clock protein KaiC